MTIELCLQKGDESAVPVTCLIGVGPEITVHAIDGALYFTETANLRVVGQEDRSGLIYELLRRTDVTVAHQGRPIFWRPDWGRELVERMCEEVVAVAEGR